MTHHLRKDLDHLKQRVLAMGGLAEESLQHARNAFATGIESHALEMREVEMRIDRLQLEVDDHIIKLLALHQPVAGDLRFVTAAMKIANDLERIGDLSSNIADRLLQSLRLDRPGVPLRMEEMMECTSRMLRDALNSFVHADSRLAREVLALDDDVDRYNREHFELLVREMQVHPEYVEMGVALLSISRNVERIADLATNIAEDVVFMVEGEDIRHPALSEP